MDKEGRSKNWQFILYLDSAPKDYIEILEAQQTKTLLSPLHDNDAWNDDDEKRNPDHKSGDFKKAHIHGIKLYSSKKTYDSFVEEMKPLNAVIDQPKSAAVYDIESAVHYLVHDGWPTKFQYEKKDIVELCGASISRYFDINNDAWQNNMIEVESFIREQMIFEFSDLWRICCTEHRDWMISIRNSRGIVQEYIKSFRNSYIDPSKVSADAETGEIQKIIDNKIL